MRTILVLVVVLACSCGLIEEESPRSVKETVACTTNRQCLDEAAGVPAICRTRDKRCVRLTTPECPNVFTKRDHSELANDDVVVIGAITPGGASELGSVMERAVEMARAEISSRFVAGLPPGGGSAGPRPLAIVSCRENAADPDGLLRAAKHLSNDVQVPMVIGPVDPTDGRVAAAQAFLPNRVLDILPAIGTSSAEDLPNPIAPTPLIWRLGFDDRAIAKVSAAFLRDHLQPALTAAGIAPPHKVAILSSGDSLAQGIQRELLKVLELNGADKTKNETLGSCPESSTKRCLEVYDVGAGDPSPAVAQLHAFQPHIVFHTYGSAGIPTIFFPTERDFPGVRKPFHVGLSPEWNASGPLFSILSTGTATGLPARLFSIQNYATRSAPPYTADSPEVVAWRARFDARFPDLTASVAAGSQDAWLLYDSTYLAAYAIVALGDKPVSGENLAGTLQRFGTVDPVVPKGALILMSRDSEQGFAELQAGRAVDLQGLFGTMDFDTSRGGPNYGLEITCPSPGGAGMRGSGFHVQVASGRAVVTSPDFLTDRPPTSPLNGCPLP